MAAQINRLKNGVMTLVETFEAVSRSESIKQREQRDTPLITEVKQR
jgi:hypothetical protein